MNRRAKIIISIVLLLLLLAGGGGYYIQNHLPERLTRLLEEELARELNPDGLDLYDIEVAEVQLNIRFPQFFIPFIKIQPKAQLFDDTSAENLPKLLIKTTIRDFGISFDGVFAAIINRNDILFNRLSLSVNNLTLLSNPEGIKAEEEETKAEQGKYGIHHLQLKVEEFVFRTLNDTLKNTAEAKNLDFTGGISYDLSADTSKVAWQVSEHALKVAEVSYFPDDDLYSYHTGNVNVVADEKRVTLSSVQVKPLYGKKEFQRHIRYQIDRMDVNVGEVTFSGFSIDELIRHQRLTLSGIIINNAHIGVFRDRNLPLDTTRRPVMPVKLMRTAPLPFFVPEIELNDLDVIYSELPEDGTTEGEVPITGIRGSISNFTNMPDSLQKDSIMHIQAAGAFFEEAQLTASFDYNLMDLNGGYSAKGELTRLDFSRLNPVLTPLLNVKVKGGWHERNTFSFSGNDVQSTGELTMHYRDLNIVLKDDQDKLIENIISWAGRNLLYHPSNPTNNNELRTGTIDFERDVTRFVFHYWWNCYLTGIKDSVLRENVDL